MPHPAHRFGLSVALATPFAEDRSIDLPRLVAHARQSLADGCSSVTVFGTTGEGASLGQNERPRALVLPRSVTAAVKALVGHRRNDVVAWCRMRAPLKSLGEAEARRLFAAIDAIRSRRAA